MYGFDARRSDIQSQLAFYRMADNLLGKMEEGGLAKDEINDILISYFGDSITIIPKDGMDARGVMLDVAASLGWRNKIDKTFSEYSGKVSYSFTLPNVNGNDIRIAVEGGTPRCKVKQVVKQVTVPARPASSYTETRFELENPEDCGVRSE